MASVVRALLALLCMLCVGTAEGYIAKAWPVRIKSWDGTMLDATYFRPVQLLGHERFPLMIFSNSWGVPGFEYTLPGYELAKRGYVVVQYETRGFFLSGGEIDLAGDADLKDHAEVITWAEKEFAKYLLQPLVVGTGGISYGGGMSLLSAVNDTRIRTVVAMSSWGSLFHAFYWNDAPSVYCMDVLMATSKLTGRDPSILETMLHDIVVHKNMSRVTAWAEQRGPLHYLDRLNARGNLSVFLSNGLGDDLFHSNMQLGFWEQLAVPKRLLLNPGWHGEWEIPGLLPGFHSYVWDKAFDWIDHYLKGAPNGADKPPLVAVSLEQRGVETLLPSDRQLYSTWPPRDDEYRVTGYALTHEGLREDWVHVLMKNASAGAAPAATISFTKKTKMNNGYIPPVRSLLEPFSPTEVDLRKLDPQHEIAFFTEALATSERLCGIVRLTNLTVSASTDRFQLFAYLYRVPHWSPLHPLTIHPDAKMITHTPFVRWDDYTAGDVTEVPPLEFRAACVDMKKGERLAVGFNLHNTLYQAGNATAGVSVSLQFPAGRPGMLEVPFVGAA
eukprot:TRINITY_DN20285_c0_g1_i1.p1 TRINITY_DN20285_c0_g1~~TRINITY_DN20285_c0_g1_i1.p1  ORF type:complete len:571 (+),score=205.64 TRINITY_DN20285_c0_g1_i1:43-1713(+)